MDTEDKKPLKPLTKAEIADELRELFKTLKTATIAETEDIEKKVAILKDMEAIIDT